jgi:hypothetical protein
MEDQYAGTENVEYIPLRVTSGIILKKQLVDQLTALWSSTTLAYIAYVIRSKCESFLTWDFIT